MRRSRWNQIPDGARATPNIMAGARYSNTISSKILHNITFHLNISRQKKISLYFSNFQKKNQIFFKSLLFSDLWLTVLSTEVQRQKRLTQMIRFPRFHHLLVVYLCLLREEVNFLLKIFFSQIITKEKSPQKKFFLFQEFCHADTPEPRGFFLFNILISRKWLVARSSDALSRAKANLSDGNTWVKCSPRMVYGQ